MCLFRPLSPDLVGWIWCSWRTSRRENKFGAINSTQSGQLKLCSVFSISSVKPSQNREQQIYFWNAIVLQGKSQSGVGRLTASSNCNYRVSQKFVPLISCAITFDQNFYFYMKFLKYNYYCIEYLCSEVQLPAFPPFFLSPPIAVATLSEMSHVACWALDDSFWAFFNHLVCRNLFDPQTI